MFKKRMLIFFLLKFTAFFSACSFDSAGAEKNKTFESGGMKLKIETVVEGLDIPWAFVFLPEGGLLITEKDGRILWHKKNASSKKLILVSGVPEVYDGGQGGLMDLVLHPDFKKQPWLYLTYSVKEKQGKTTKLARALWDQGSLKNFSVLFTAEPFYPANIHFGSRVVFDKKGYMFFTVGDRRQRKLAQSTKTHNGKVFRLFDDGKIPPDNPFKDSPIWSYGHRNAQGIALRKDEVWINEHGPRGGDEMNKIKKGQNYGWPVVTYGKEYIGGRIGEGYTKAGMEDPVKYYVPSIAPSSLAYYDGDLFPAWKDSFFSGALALRHLNRVSAEDLSKEERLLAFLNKRVRDVRVGPEGYIYVAVENGAILKITPRSPAEGGLTN